MQQRFAVLQSMWAMERQYTDSNERSIEQNISLIVEDGFDGISVSSNQRDLERVRETASIIRGQNLVVEAMCTITSAEELQMAICNAELLGAHHLNVQAAVRPRNVGEALSYLQDWRDATTSAPFPVLFETHRDRLTNDLNITLELLDKIPDLMLLADLSHYVVSREFAWPVSDETHALMHQILDRSWAMHGRVSSDQQIQVQISYPQHRPWMELFLEWWRYGIESWRSRAATDGILCFTCEIGPKPYAITGADGNDTTDRWEESKTMKAEMKRLWEQVTASSAR